ncbi:MAG: hypothetical protein [Caudoviricetes sp.]|nr:MAG: hypothetical protein [Caudoviricetes sp.]
MVYDLILYYGNPKGAESYLRLVEHLISIGWTKGCETEQKESEPKSD